MLRNIFTLIFICLVSNAYAQGLLQNEDFKTESELITAGGSKSQLLNDTKVYVTADGINETLDDAISLGLLGFQSPLTTEGDLLSFISGANTRLAIGSEGQLLTVVSGVPSWQDAPVTLPDQSGEAGNYLKTDGTSASWEDVNYDIAKIKTNQINCPSFEGCDASEWVVTNSAGTLLPLVGLRTIHTSSRNDRNLQVAAIGSAADISATLTKTVNLSGVQLKAYCEILATEDGYTFKAGANGVVQGQHEIIGDTKFRFYEIYLSGGDTSQFIQISKDGASDGSGLQVDNCFIGKVSPTDIREVSGAQFVGSSTEVGASGCDNLTTVSTAGTWYDMTTDTSCSSYSNTGGVIGTNDKNEITILNARTDGYYRIEISSIILATSGNCQFRFYDGENYFGFLQSQSYTTTPPSTLSDSSFSGETRFTTSGDKVLKLVVNSTANGSLCATYNDFSDDRRTKKWSVYFFPDSTSNIVTQNTELTAQTANEFVANVSSTGVVSGENFDWINGNCAIVSSRYECTPTSETAFGATPNCVANYDGQNTYGADYLRNLSTTSKLVFVVTDKNAGTTGITSQPFTISCTRSTDYRKSATIIGKFENINSSELCQVEAVSNDAEAITAETEDIPFKTIIKDNCNNWSNAGNTGANTNDAYTAKRDSLVLVNGSVAGVSAIGNYIGAYVNGSLRSTCSQQISTARYSFNCLVDLKKDEALTFRLVAANNITLATSSLSHRINITELPDTESIIKNLSTQKTKCQTKILASNVTVTGDIASLGFAGLSVGKKYVAKVNIATAQQSSTTMTVNAKLVNGTTDLVRFSYAGSGNADALRTTSLTPVFVSTNASLILNVETLTNANILGDGSLLNTWVELCELPDTYVETTEW